MNKELDYEITYFEKGEKKTIPVKICFTSQYVTRKNDEIIYKVANFKKISDEIDYHLKESGTMLHERKEGWQEALKVSEKKRKELQEQMKAYSSENICKEQFELVKIILEDNGIEDERLYTYEFWDRKAARLEMTEFIVKVALKDKEEVAHTEKKKSTMTAL
jgi:hypothetical protein